MNNRWSSAPSNPHLVHDEVHLWRARLDEHRRICASFEACLADDERERASRFVNANDRDHFIAGRGILRTILGRYLGCSAGAIEFTYQPEGKPLLRMRGAGHSICFNLAHSRGLAVYAFSSTCEVGVDVEAVRSDLDPREIAEHFFSPNEIVELNSFPPHQQHEAFFHCWTRKEAYIKAQGRGFAIGLNSFDVSTTPGESEGLVYHQGTGWTWRNFSPAERYVGAVVTAGNGWTLRCWDFHLSSHAGLEL